MSLPQSTDLSPFLAVSTYIDWQHREIMALAAQFSTKCPTREDIARACYLFVRDEIRHAGDWQLSPTTCKASEVLREGHGWCYAKSHLLAALLRANAIPAGLCYQRLTIENDAPPFCIHGLVAVYLENHGWYRIDPRGNKPGVAADFTPPVEKLAFQLITDGETDFQMIFFEPLQVVTDCLTRFSTAGEVRKNLPDIQPPLKQIALPGHDPRFHLHNFGQ